MLFAFIRILIRVLLFMAKYLGPKCKLCRRLGTKLCSKGERGTSAKCALVKRSYPPGAHGSKGYGRQTDYGLHLQEKQKLKVMYGVLERQMSKYFKEAVRSKGDSGLKLLELLESRLDNVIYRLGLATSRPQARQFVSHGLFLVNNKKVNIPSWRVKVGDAVTLKKEKSKSQGVLAENLKKMEKRETPIWLNWTPKDFKGQVVARPQGKDLEVGVDIRLVVEFYSR